jgi:hypothetical protein
MTVAGYVAQKRDKHGLHALKRRVSTRGMADLDGRSKAMRAVSEWKAELIRDLGGDPSAQKLTLIDAATKTMLYLNHIDSYLMRAQSLVNKRKRAILPILRERQALVDSLSRLLSQIGLERAPRPVPKLSEFIAEFDAAKAKEQV